MNEISASRWERERDEASEKENRRAMMISTDGTVENNEFRISRKANVISGKPIDAFWRSHRRRKSLKYLTHVPCCLSLDCLFSEMNWKRRLAFSIKHGFRAMTNVRRKERGRAALRKDMMKNKTRDLMLHKISQENSHKGIHIWTVKQASFALFNFIERFPISSLLSRVYFNVFPVRLAITLTRRELLMNFG